jgi:hypothetical protein
MQTRCDGSNQAPRLSTAAYPHRACRSTISKDSDREAASGSSIFVMPPHHCNFSDFRFFLRCRKIALYFSFAAFWSLSPASADSIAENSWYANTKNIYVHQSLGNPGQRLRKIDKIGPIVVKTICVGTIQSKCVHPAINSRFSSAVVVHERLRFKFSTKASDPDIEIILTDQSSTLSKRQELSATYANGFRDSDDPDCQLYYSLQGHVIKKVVVVVSLDSPEFKQRACYMSQLHQGLGLALPDSLPFSKLWNKQPDGYSTLTEALFTRLVKTYGVLSYVQMCPELKPGMDASSIGKFLDKGSPCFSGLKVKFGQ